MIYYKCISYEHIFLTIYMYYTKESILLLAISAMVNVCTLKYIHQRFSKGKILHLCIFVSPNNSILPSSGII